MYMYIHTRGDSQVSNQVSMRMTCVSVVGYWGCYDPGTLVLRLQLRIEVQIEYSLIDNLLDSSTQSNKLIHGWDGRFSLLSAALIANSMHVASFFLMSLSRKSK